MEHKLCLATVLLLAAALATSGQPAGERDATALRSPNWGFLAAAPPPPPPPLPALANLYTIINGRSVTPHSYINALHQNLLNLHFTKPLASAKTSVLSPAKFLDFQPSQHVFPWNYQLLRTPIAEPYQFPTNRPPPAVTAEASTTTTRAPPTPPPSPSPEGSAEEVTGGSTSSTEDTGSGTTPAPPAENKPTLLILKPFAKAVAGINGTAVATPVGHAIYHKGQPVDVVFDPRAVAVAGPGGNARAHSDLIVSYVEEEK